MSSKLRGSYSEPLITGFGDVVLEELVLESFPAFPATRNAGRF